MKPIFTTLFFLAPTLAFAAGGPTALGPNGGKFGDWTAATYGSGADKACYAFTNAQHSDPAIGKRGAVMLTVTERQGAHDEVTLTSGYAYPKDAKVSISVNNHAIDFYTQGNTAFTSDGHGAVEAFRNGAAAEAKGTGPHGHPVTDDFSLNGFSGAYSAISSACP
jgi:Invasion associated locus B (IalB) protein